MYRLRLRPKRGCAKRGEMASYEYKVLTQRDRRFSGKFNPESMEAALNGYSSEGWHLVAAVTAEFKGGLSSREELIFLMERPNG